MTQEAGIHIVRRALQAMARQIATNAGEEAAIIVGKVLENNADTFGYNTATGEFGDLIAFKNC
ncbi:chaperonin GroEL (HSP60 family) [Bartonella silvatica]|uniref:Chaperonin GroEL (HSP60 family) n=1 Tax=Bartonella silvatica TaxID=357760 RepID=A0ABV2HGJ0_9HYPH